MGAEGCLKCRGGVLSEVAGGVRDFEQDGEQYRGGASNIHGSSCGLIGCVHCLPMDIEKRGGCYYRSRKCVDNDSWLRGTPGSSSYGRLAQLFVRFP